MDIVNFARNRPQDRGFEAPKPSNRPCGDRSRTFSDTGIRNNSRRIFGRPVTFRFCAGKEGPVSHSEGIEGSVRIRAHKKKTQFAFSAKKRKTQEKRKTQFALRFAFCVFFELVAFGLRFEIAFLFKNAKRKLRFQNAIWQNRLKFKTFVQNKFKIG